MQKADIEITQFESLKRIYDSILMKSHSEDEVLARVINEITIKAAAKNFPVLMSKRQVRELLGVDNNALSDAIRNLSDAKVLPLIQNKKFTAIHVAAIINELHQLK